MEIEEQAAPEAASGILLEQNSTRSLFGNDAYRLGNRDLSLAAYLNENVMAPRLRIALNDLYVL
jgi:hypothetical protein